MTAGKAMIVPHSFSIIFTSRDGVLTLPSSCTRDFKSKDIDQDGNSISGKG
jgi:hypothetical protein